MTQESAQTSTQIRTAIAKLTQERDQADRARQASEVDRKARVLELSDTDLDAIEAEERRLGRVVDRANARLPGLQVELAVAVAVEADAEKAAQAAAADQAKAEYEDLSQRLLPLLEGPIAMLREMDRLNPIARRGGWAMSGVETRVRLPGFDLAAEVEARNLAAQWAAEERDRRFQAEQAARVGSTPKISVLPAAYAGNPEGDRIPSVTTLSGFELEQWHRDHARRNPERH